MVINFGLVAKEEGLGHAPNDGWVSATGVEHAGLSTFVATALHFAVQTPEPLQEPHQDHAADLARTSRLSPRAPPARGSRFLANGRAAGGEHHE